MDDEYALRENQWTKVLWALVPLVSLASADRSQIVPLKVGRWPVYLSTGEVMAY